MSGQRKAPWELRDDPVAHLRTLTREIGVYADSLNALVARAEAAESNAQVFHDEWDKSLARAEKAEAALRDVEIALADPLCDGWTVARIREMPSYLAGQEGKP